MNFPTASGFFELAAVADPAAVPYAVAAVLGITRQPGKSVAESVAAALEGRVRLLVFDNCEHVRDAAGGSDGGHPRAVGDRDDSHHHPRRIGVADEQLWPVPLKDLRAVGAHIRREIDLERARDTDSAIGMTPAQK